MKRWKGLTDLVVDAVDWTTRLAEENHDSVATKAYGIAKAVPGLEGPAEAVESVHRLTAKTAYGSVLFTNAVVGAALSYGHRIAAVVAAEGRLGDEPSNADEGAATPIRSDAMGSVSWLRDSAISALNGAVGDYLDRTGNDLGYELSLRVDGQHLPLVRDSVAAAYPEATSKICVLVHGLMCTEWSFSMFAEEAHGDASATYGSLLARDLGYTPIYVRYNSGRHISDNGQDLAARLEELLEAYPVAVEEIVLVGHSMGGLVSRSACHYGAEAGHGWTEHVRHVFCVGSPHLGAPLEKAGHLLQRVLSMVDLPGTQIPARVADGRSAGIKDLRNGAIVEEHWPDRAPEERLRDCAGDVPWLPHANYYFVAATITDDPEHPVGSLVGDLLVRRPSAKGHDSARVLAVGQRDELLVRGASHMRLVNHPEVYERIRSWCEAG